MIRFCAKRLIGVLLLICMATSSFGCGLMSVPGDVATIAPDAAAAATVAPTTPSTARPAAATAAGSPTLSPSKTLLPVRTPRITEAQNAEENPARLDSYEAIKAVNADTIGWLTLPNTRIDYPVMLCDDNEYYINHSAESKKELDESGNVMIKPTTRGGTPFMDYRNANPEQQRQLIIYGVSMRDGTMFYDLINYKDEVFFQKNRIFSFVYKGEETRWEIYMAGVWDSEKLYFHHTRFPSDEQFADFENEVIASMPKADIVSMDRSFAIQPGDQVLMLSTVSYEFDGAYMSVWARRIGGGNSAQQGFESISPRLNGFAIQFSKLNMIPPLYKTIMLGKLNAIASNKQSFSTEKSRTKQIIYIGF